MLSKSAKIRVRFSETDAMGVVYHANYLPWFEAARIELLDSLGLPYKKIVESGFHIPVLEVHIKYLSPSRFDDKLEVVAMMRERPGARMKIEYSIRRGADEIVRGHTMHAFINSQGAPVKPPRDVMDRLREKFDESGGA